MQMSSRGSMACGRCPVLLPTSCFQTEPELASSHGAAAWPQMKNYNDQREFLNVYNFCFSLSIHLNHSQFHPCAVQLRVSLTFRYFSCSFLFTSPYPAELRVLDAVCCSRALQAWQRLAETEFELRS